MATKRRGEARWTCNCTPSNTPGGKSTVTDVFSVWDPLPLQQNGMSDGPARDGSASYLHGLQGSLIILPLPLHVGHVLRV